MNERLCYGARRRVCYTLLSWHCVSERAFVVLCAVSSNERYTISIFRWWKYSLLPRHDADAAAAAAHTLRISPVAYDCVRSVEQACAVWRQRVRIRKQKAHGAPILLIGWKRCHQLRCQLLRLPAFGRRGVEAALAHPHTAACVCARAKYELSQLPLR